MRTFAIECGDEAPEKLGNKRWHRHTATMSQILNSNDNELDSLTQHMGHDIGNITDFPKLHFKLRRYRNYC